MRYGRFLVTWGPPSCWGFRRTATGAIGMLAGRLLVAWLSPTTMRQIQEWEKREVREAQTPP